MQDRFPVKAPGARNHSVVTMSHGTQHHGRTCPDKSGIPDPNLSSGGGHFEVTILKWRPWVFAVFAFADLFDTLPGA
jgi:hypothetical protein